MAADDAAAAAQVTAMKQARLEAQARDITAMMDDVAAMLSRMREVEAELALALAETPVGEAAAEKRRGYQEQQLRDTAAHAEQLQRELDSLGVERTRINDELQALQAAT